jgi:hypothetical protein
MYIFLLKVITIIERNFPLQCVDEKNFNDWDNVLNVVEANKLYQCFTRDRLILTAQLFYVSLDLPYSCVYFGKSLLVFGIN